MNNYSAQSVSVIISAYGDFWEHSVFFTLASIKRQLFERAKIQLILISSPEVFVDARQKYSEWDIQNVAVKTDGHYKNRYLAEAVNLATGEITILLDGDVIIPNYSLLHIDQILRLEPKTCLMGHQRQDLTLDDINSFPSKHWHDLGFDEYLNASLGEKALLKELVPIHPFTACGFLVAVKSEHLTSIDFCPDYDGFWGEEDHDLAATLYKKGVNIKHHQKLPVLHWRHAKQSKTGLKRQLNILFGRHGDIPSVSREMLVSGAANNYHFWYEEPVNKYQPVWHYMGGSKNSLALHSGSMVSAMDTVSYLDGNPHPHFVHNITDLSWQTYPHLIKDAQLRSIGNLPTINIYNEVNDQPNQTKIYEGYNIGYLYLEGRLISDSYLAYLDQYDEIWVAGNRQEDNLIKSGWQKPITTISNGFFPEVFFPQSKNDHDGIYRFLTIGMGHRKNNYKLVDIFAQTFTPEGGVQLVLMVGYQTAVMQAYVKEFWPDRSAQFKFIEGDQTAKQVAAIYNNVDAFISISSGETWNLPVIEAAACGVPVISPMGNGVDYITEDTAILFPSRPIEANSLFAYVEPSFSHIAAIMRGMVYNPTYRQEAKHKALKLLPIVHGKYSWYEAARQAYRRLDEISGKL